MLQPPNSRNKCNNKICEGITRMTGLPILPVPLRGNDQPTVLLVRMYVKLRILNIVHWVEAVTMLLLLLISNRDENRKGNK